METKRIYMVGPSGYRDSFRVWLEFETDSPHYRFYVPKLRSTYRHLRKAGLSAYDARWWVYELLLLGRQAARTKDYGAAR
jgi:hypothetical protein